MLDHRTSESVYEEIWHFKNCIQGPRPLREDSWCQKGKLVAGMTMTDPIADYLTRVRNAIQAKHKRVEIPSNRVKLALTQLLLEKSLIAGYSEVEAAPQKMIRIQLKYKGGESAIMGMKRVSRPGLRKYVSSEDIPRVLGGLGLGIVSTSRGLMTDKDARAAGVGGELLCEIW